MPRSGQLQAHVVYPTPRIMLSYEKIIFTSFSQRRERMHSAQNAQEAPACDHVLSSCRDRYRIRRSPPHARLSLFLYQASQQE